MIKIHRSDPPECLVKSDDMFAKGDCRRPDVKYSLLGMQHGKCCYCERKISDLSDTEREVEHYVPKSALKDGAGNIQWYLANKWENLLYACRSCNSSKGKQHPIDSLTGDSMIINPSLEDLDPEDHIDFIIDDYLVLFAEKNNSSLGRSTIEKLKFHERSDLFSDFRRIKSDIDHTFMELVNASTSGDKATATSKLSELNRSTSAHRPFAAFQRNYIGKRAQELNDKRHMFTAIYGRPLDIIEVQINKGYDVEA